MRRERQEKVQRAPIPFALYCFVLEAGKSSPPIYTGRPPRTGFRLRSFQTFRQWKDWKNPRLHDGLSYFAVTWRAMVLEGPEREEGSGSVAQVAAYLIALGFVAFRQPVGGGLH
jgi:hypothetical protein